MTRELDIIKIEQEHRRVKDKYGEVSEKLVGEKIYYKRPNNTVGIQHRSLDDERTIQSQEKESNINNIVRKHSNQEIFNRFVFDANDDGIIDISDITDYHGHMNKITRAKTQFMKIPSRIRKRFDNSPEKFVKFCSNPDNLEEMVKLGLAENRAPAPVTEPSAEPTSTPEAPEGGE